MTFLLEIWLAELKIPKDIQVCLHFPNAITIRISHRVPRCPVSIFEHISNNYIQLYSLGGASQYEMSGLVFQSRDPDDVLILLIYRHLSCNVYWFLLQLLYRVSHYWMKYSLSHNYCYTEGFHFFSERYISVLNLKLEI